MRTIVLSRRHDLSPTDATRIATTLGLTNLRFIYPPKRAAHTPGIPSRCTRMSVGGRYLASVRAA